MSFREKFKLKQEEARKRIEKESQPTIKHWGGRKWIIPAAKSFAYLLPKERKKAEETEYHPDLLAQFYKDNRWGNILGEKQKRFSKSDLINHSYRAYAYHGYFIIKVEQGFRTDTHNAALFATRDKWTYVANVPITANFYKPEEMLAAVTKAIRLKKFKIIQESKAKFEYFPENDDEI